MICFRIHKNLEFSNRLQMPGNQFRKNLRRMISSRYIILLAILILSVVACASQKAARSSNKDIVWICEHQSYYGSTLSGNGFIDDPKLSELLIDYGCQGIIDLANEQKRFDDDFWISGITSSDYQLTNLTIKNSSLPLFEMADTSADSLNNIIRQFRYGMYTRYLKYLWEPKIIVDSAKGMDDIESLPGVDEVLTRLLETDTSDITITPDKADNNYPVEAIYNELAIERANKVQEKKMKLNLFKKIMGSYSGLGWNQKVESSGNKILALVDLGLPGDEDYFWEYIPVMIMFDPSGKVSTARFRGFGEDPSTVYLNYNYDNKGKLDSVRLLYHYDYQGQGLFETLLLCQPGK
jgi:hypothetical protein